jgi:hypothetical protein
MERSQEVELVTKSRLNKYRSRVRKYMAYLLGRRTALAEEMAALMPARRGESMHGRKGSKVYQSMIARAAGSAAFIRHVAQQREPSEDDGEQGDTFGAVVGYNSNLNRKRKPKHRGGGSPSGKKDKELERSPSSPSLALHSRSHSSRGENFSRSEKETQSSIGTFGLAKKPGRQDYAESLGILSDSDEESTSHSTREVPYIIYIHM